VLQPDVQIILARYPSPSSLSDVQITDATKKAVDNILKTVPTYLHPNPGMHVRSSFSL
jgi:hypothetical protein